MMQNAEYPQLSSKESEDLKHITKLIWEKTLSAFPLKEHCLRYDLIEFVYTSVRWIKVFYLYFT